MYYTTNFDRVSYNRHYAYPGNNLDTAMIQFSLLSNFKTLHKYTLLHHIICQDNIVIILATRSTFASTIYILPFLQPYLFDV